MESFSQLPLSPLLLKAVASLGYEKPSPIQAQALPILLGEPTDFIGLAATGTGKTAAFSLPLLDKIDLDKGGVQALVLCPTRELALQVAGQITLMGKAKGIKALPIYGGSSYGDQIRGLRDGATVVVGTPGRIVDHMERGTLILSDLDTIVLDEADEMISMGFKEELEKILAASPKEKCKIWLFSATMSREIRSIADNYLTQPKQVQVNKTEMLSGTVEQIFYRTQEANKPEVLCKIIEMADNFYGLVFCQTKSLVTDLTQYLLERGYKTDCLHGDKDQNARERTMQAFRDKRVTILICTDVASRGIDVKDITHVINYSLPRELDNYVHRIGRTARSGKSGYAMSLVTPSHRDLLFRIERMTKSRMTEGQIPTRRDIGKKKIASLLEKFSAQKNFSKATEILNETWSQLLSSMPAEEVAGRFLNMMYPEIFENGPEHERVSMRPQESRQRHGDEGGRARRPQQRSRDRREGDDNRRSPRRDSEESRASFARSAGKRSERSRSERSFEGPSSSVSSAERAPSAAANFPIFGKRVRTGDEKRGGGFPPRRRSAIEGGDRPKRSSFKERGDRPTRRFRD